jgi:hypothetical protein
MAPWPTDWVSQRQYFRLPDQRLYARREGTQHAGSSSYQLSLSKGRENWSHLLGPAALTPCSLVTCKILLHPCITDDRELAVPADADRQTTVRDDKRPRAQTALIMMRDSPLDTDGKQHGCHVDHAPSVVVGATQRQPGSRQARRHRSPTLARVTEHVLRC